MPRYICKCVFPDAIDQMFLTARVSVQGSFRASFGVASVFVHVVSRPGWGPICFPLSLCLFSSVLI